jgi:hypothetical protein
MAIETIRDVIKLSQVVCEETSQALVEGEAVLSEEKLPAARILDVSGTAVLSGCEVMQDKVMVEGVLRYDILYVPEEGGIETTEADIGFTHALNLPGAGPKMDADIHLSIEHLDYEMLSARKVSVKAVLNLQGNVQQVMEVETLKAFKGLEDVEVLTDRIHGKVLYGSGRSQTMIREDMELADAMPSIQKILRKDVKVKINEKKAADNKVIVHGDLAMKILYLSEDTEEPVQVLTNTVPFSHFVDIEGAYAGIDCVVEASAAEFYAEAKEDINQELRLLDAEVILSVSARVFENQEWDILTDAYSPTLPLRLKKKKIQLTQTVGEQQGQSVIKHGLSLPAGLPAIKKVLYVDAVPMVTDARAEAGKVTLEGFLAVQVVYQSADAEALVSSFKEDIPFKHAAEVAEAEASMDIRWEVRQEHGSCTLSAREEAELKIVLSAKVSVFRSVEQELLMDAEEAEGARMQEGGMYIYFVQPGDSLWTVAKKYNTTIANILKFNALSEQEGLQAGSRLIIFKKLNPLAG